MAQPRRRSPRRAPRRVEQAVYRGRFRYGLKRRFTPGTRQPYRETLADSIVFRGEFLSVKPFSQITGPMSLRAPGSGAPLRSGVALRSIANTIEDTLTLTDSSSSMFAMAEGIAEQVVFGGEMLGVSPMADTPGAMTLRSATTSQPLRTGATLRQQAGALTETLSDALTLTDAGVAGWAGAETRSDSLTLTDASTPDWAGAETLSDALALTEASVFDWAGVDTVTEALAFTDARADTAHFVQASSDTAVFTDALQEGFRWSDSLTDNLALTDASAFDWAATEPLANAVVFADAVAEGRRFTTTQSDTLALTDTNAADWAGVETLSDTATLTDALAYHSAFVNVVVPDAVFFTDASADTFTGSSGTEYGENLSDALALAPELVADWAGVDALADALALADVWAADWAGAESAADSLVLVDAGGDSADWVEARTDTLSLSDENTSDWAGVEGRSDALTFTDVSAFDWATSETVTNTVVFADQLTHTSAFVQVLADSLVFTATFAETYIPILGWSYANILEHTRAAIEAATGRTTFLSQATGRPEFPYCVLHAFGHSGKVTNALSRDNVEASFYLQIDGVGRTWTDALWMIDRAARAIRAMDRPPGVADMVIVGRASPTPLEGEGVVAVGQRLNLRATREPELV